MKKYVAVLALLLMVSIACAGTYYLSVWRNYSVNILPYGESLMVSDESGTYWYLATAGEEFLQFELIYPYGYVNWGPPVTLLTFEDYGEDTHCGIVISYTGDTLQDCLNSEPAQVGVWNAEPIPE